MQGMQKYILLLLCFSAVVILSCREDDAMIGDFSSSNRELKLYASIGDGNSTTRFTITQDTLIHLNETVYIWADEIKELDTVPKIKCWTTVSDGTGILNPLYLSSRYYPTSNYPLRMMGLHGNFHYKENAARPSLVNHTVKLDQTALADYLVSDLLCLDTLLYYSKFSASGGAFLLHLRFKHLLSRIELCFQPWGSLTDDSLVGARVFIENVLPVASVDLVNKRVVTNGSVSTIEVPLHTIPWSATNFDGATYGEAVIPAQKIRPDRVLFRLQTAYGRNYYFLPDTVYTFQPGKRYRFNMCVKHIIKFGDGTEGSKVEPWDYDPVNEQEFCLTPMTIPPGLVDTWTYDSISQGWSFMVPPPGVEAWIYSDSIARNWSAITPAATENGWVYDAIKYKPLTLVP